MSPERSECMPASCGLRHPSRRDHAGEGREARQDPAVEPRRRWADAEIRAAASAAYKSLLFPAGLRISASDRKSTRLNSSHVAISYAVFCLKKKKKKTLNA